MVGSKIDSHEPMIPGRRRNQQQRQIWTRTKGPATNESRTQPEEAICDLSVESLTEDEITHIKGGRTGDAIEIKQSFVADQVGQE